MKRALAACVFIGLFSCKTKHEAGIMLVIPSELSTPRDIDAVRIDVVHPTRGEVARHEISMRAGEGFPLGFGVGPSQSGQDGPYTFRVSGMLHGQPKTLRLAVAEVPRVGVQDLTMPVEFLCYGDVRIRDDGATENACGVGQTCVFGECKPIPTYDAQHPLPAHVLDPTPHTIGSTVPCYDGPRCFESSSALAPDLTACRVTLPVGFTNTTLGLLLSPERRGVPFRDKRLIVFDNDAEGGFRAVNGQVELPRALCRSLSNNPDSVLVASTACPPKTIALPLCSVSASTDPMDASLPADAFVSDVDSTADGVVESSPPDSDGTTAPSDGAATKDARADSRGAACVDASTEGGVCEFDNVVCWGYDDAGQASPEPGFFVQITGGLAYTCGLRRDQKVVCWGHDANGRATPAAGTFRSISAGWEHSCGVRTNGTVACWGQNVDGRATPNQGEFDSVSAGKEHTCGIRANGTVECWGKELDGRATPPAGNFTSVSASDLHTCGLKADETIVCWGSNEDNRSTPPPGSYKAVSTGGHHTCGLKTDGTIVCWGANWAGQSNPPTGAFASLSAGWAITCGTRLDGRVACWGENDHGQAAPPEGSFASLSWGWEHVCGILRAP